jgi:Uma2 family endonuclease
MQTKTSSMTVAEFHAFTALPQNANKNFELLQGEVLEVPSPKKYHAMIVVRIAALLYLYMEANNVAGSVIGDNLDHQLGEENVLKPDVGFTSLAREAAVPAYPTIAPDLVVEVVSPSNTLHEFNAKMKIYFEHGTQLVWLVYPESKTVHVYERTEILEKPHIFILTVDDVIEGGNVLPGLKIQVGKFFPALPLKDDAL